MAEGILKNELAQRNLNNVEVDSAGFEPFHEGDRPDGRGMATLKKHGIDISSIRSRLFQVEDFDRFDKIYVMDSNNYADVMSVTRDDDDAAKVEFIMNKVQPGQNNPVPDPYYGGKDGFKTIYQMLDEACERVADEIAAHQKP